MMEHILRFHTVYGSPEDTKGKSLFCAHFTTSDLEEIFFLTRNSCSRIYDQGFDAYGAGKTTFYKTFDVQTGLTADGQATYSVAVTFKNRMLWTGFPTNDIPKNAVSIYTSILYFMTVKFSIVSTLFVIEMYFIFVTILDCLDPFTCVHCKM